MRTFKNVAVLLNNTGIAAQRATVVISNSLTQNNSVGAYNSHLIPNGPITAQANIEYTPRILTDPIIANIVYENTLIDSNRNISDAPIPIVLTVGNISGSFLLESLKFNLASNDILTTSASFVSYSSISGLGNPDGYSSSLYNDLDEIGHGLTTSLSDINGNEISKYYYELDYSVSKVLIPIFKLGQKEPFQILCPKINFEASASFEDFYNVSFEGDSPDSAIGNCSYIKLKGYDSLEFVESSTESASGTSGSSGSSGYSGVSGVDKILLSLNNMRIIESSTDFSLNNIVKTKIKAIKST